MVGLMLVQSTLAWRVWGYAEAMVCRGWRRVEKAIPAQSLKQLLCKD